MFQVSVRIPHSSPCHRNMWVLYIHPRISPIKDCRSSTDSHAAKFIIESLEKIYKIYYARQHLIPTIHKSGRILAVRRVFHAKLNTGCVFPRIKCERASWVMLMQMSLPASKYTQLHPDCGHYLYTRRATQYFRGAGVNTEWVNGTEVAHNFRGPLAAYIYTQAMFTLGAAAYDPRSGSESFFLYSFYHKMSWNS